ncbi:hypothetical protein B0H13DRAFT_1860979 [Mycena leptocephala]|nr:hypothetical protein B0H13DRAFT_1860979 [Mycena leptocephala]
MPRLSVRQARARNILTAFTDHHKAHIKQGLRRRTGLRRIFTRAGLTPQDLEELTAPALLLAVELASWRFGYSGLRLSPIAKVREHRVPPSRAGTPDRGTP